MSQPRIHLSTTPERLAAGSAWATGFLAPRWSVRCDPGTLRATARAGGTDFKTWDDPLDALAWMSTRFPDDRGRWIGYLSYDFGRVFEALPSRAVDDLGLPLFHFTYCVPVAERPPLPEPEYGRSDAPLRSTFPRSAYEAAVRRALDYVAAGDVFQVNLSQRFTVGLREHPAVIYQRLAREHPAVYGAYLALDDYAIVSNSPELFLRVEPQPDGRRRVTTRPIKGTRPRAPGSADELRRSPKDRAELNMIVDLERNDLGRVCEIGSVCVTEPRAIEAHPTVYHGVATVQGVLRRDVTFADLLRATFPGGSVTGAPKIRAMQIIDELEPVRRGPYCGTIGYLAADGAMEFSVAIRTMVARDGKIHIPVGGGVVADSDPAEEYEETLVKARAMFAAVGVDAGQLEQVASPTREDHA